MGCLHGLFLFLLFAFPSSPASGRIRHFLSPPPPPPPPPPPCRRPPRRRLSQPTDQPLPSAKLWKRAVEREGEGGRGRTLAPKWPQRRRRRSGPRGRVQFFSRGSGRSCPSSSFSWPSFKPTTPFLLFLNFSTCAQQQYFSLAWPEHSPITTTSKAAPKGEKERKGRPFLPPSPHAMTTTVHTHERRRRRRRQAQSSPSSPDRSPSPLLFPHAFLLFFSPREGGENPLRILSLHVVYVPSATSTAIYHGQAPRSC